MSKIEQVLEIKENAFVQKFLKNDNSNESQKALINAVLSVKDMRNITAHSRNLSQEKRFSGSLLDRVRL